MAPTNRRIVLRRYPSGTPRVEDFEVVEAPLSDAGPGFVRIETDVLSMDPAPRLRMNGAAKFPPPLPLNETVVGRGVGRVTQSGDPAFSPGDVVAGDLGWQEHAIVRASDLRAVDTSLGPSHTALGLLGPSGIAAWFLVREAARVAAAETVVIAAAAGAVGSTAVQLARLAGARVVGIVGSPAQTRFVLEELGATAVVDYTSAHLDADLRGALPTGANVFLDSVGGDLHNSVMEHLAAHARIVAFGYISAYNAAAGTQAEYGRIYQLIHQRAELRGFLVGDYAARFAEALAGLAEAFRCGQIKAFETFTFGLDSVPGAFAALFTGDPVGKQLVRLRSPVTDHARS